MIRDRVDELDDPQLRPFAPLVYVAWSDFDLDRDEREKVLSTIAAQPWLRPAARAVIAAWLDPAAPPTAAELGRLRALIERVVVTASTRARASFARLASDIADEETRDVALDLAANLGMISGEETAPAPLESDPAIVRGLASVLDGDHASVRASVRAWLGREPRRAYGLPVDEHRTFVRGWLADFASTGLGRLAYPGVTSAQDLAAFTAVFEELGHGDLSLLVKVGVQLGLYGGAIWALGTERHHARLAKVAACEELGCFAMSEVGHGSNVAGVETTATYFHDTRELEIHTPGESARKEWIGGAAHDARFAVVFAQLDVDGARQGVHAVLVRIRADDGSPMPGVRTGDSGHKLGLNGVDNGRLWFERLRVPVDSLLDRFASIDESGTYTSPIASPDRRFFTMLGTLIGGRVSVGAGAVSAARSALAIAVRYAHARRQFGPEGERRLIDYPTHQRRLLPHLADTVVLRIAFAALRARHATALADRDADTREIEAEAAAMKILGSRHAIAAVQEAREACGGQGYASVNRIPEIRADVDIFTTFEGDNVVLAQLVGKGLLGAQRKQLAAGGTLAVLRAVGRRIATAVTEKNPVQSRRGASSHLRDREMQLDAFRYRERHLVETCMLRIKKRLDAGVDGETAVLAVQEHVVAIADAFAERLAAEWFAAAEAKAPPEVRPLLARIGDLSLLSRLEARASWFLETDYFEAGKTRAIRKEVERLLAEVAPHAREIVDAFQIPDACLAAPIAFFDPAHPMYD
ncbi:MAG: acyl-CoA dehydrogenase [Kofleriaceae bacterium]